MRFGLPFRDRGAPYDDYFARLNTMLLASGKGRPHMVVDLDLVDHNLAGVTNRLQPDQPLRLVVKSLPSLPLLEYLADSAATNRFMVFHGPFLEAIVARWPDADILIGKPLPLRAVEAFYDAPVARNHAAMNIQWLADTVERLHDYALLASGRGLPLRINLEIDVGLHRGGFVADNSFATALRLLRESEVLQFSGLMGYDAHAASAPGLWTSFDGEIARIKRRYEAFLNIVRQVLPDQDLAQLTLNGGGSKTFMKYPDGPINDISVGSAILQPTDFDIPALSAHKPACWIAVPVLKVLDGTRIPFLEKPSAWLAALNPNWRRTYFIYGGGWLATYEQPPGLRDDPVYGFSTNQGIVHGSPKTGLQPDDHVFLRPTQSEKVLRDFGNLLIVRGGTFVDDWPVLAE